jgi:hypothetical protein
MRKKQRRAFAINRASTVRLQAMQRLVLAKETLRLLQDPYADMTYQQFQDLYRTEHAALETAISAKQFQKAADMEPTLAKMKDLLEANFFDFRKLFARIFICCCDQFQC